MNEDVLKEIDDLIQQSDIKDCDILNNIKNIIDNKLRLNLQTIETLKDREFIVPSYQRGYKWKPQQVEDLLNDIWDFYSKHKEDIENGKNIKEFYCLQPIVVKKNNDESAKWKLIDGQQRLTTIFIILQYLDLDEELFTVDYQTRDESTKFLKNIKKEQNSTSLNIDCHHFQVAHKTIKNWFEDEDKKIEKEKWKVTLLSYTKIIWYVAKAEESNSAIQDAIAIFMRLNSGKIPLTNSELIRALFLHNSSNSTNQELNFLQQSKIATEWDYIEQQLHNDDFWGFITLGENLKDEDYPNRIEFIFDLIEGGSKKELEDKYSTYRMYEKWINKENKTIVELWHEVKEYYYRFHEWYIDDELYHLLGYSWLVSSYTIKDALAFAGENSQSKLIEELKIKVTDILTEYFDDEETNGFSLEKLRYGEHNQKIINILKLFNVYTHMQENTRCPLGLYKRIQWSLEHIHAQSSKELDNDNWENWANLTARENESLQNILKKWSSENSNKEIIRTDFENKVGQLFGDIKDYMHTLMNMALLGKSANSALGNKIFPQKRNAVLGFIENNNYTVPIATRNVFLKYYNPNPGEMHKWDIADCKAYEESLIKCLNCFNIKVKPTTMEVENNG